MIDYFKAQALVGLIFFSSLLFAQSGQAEQFDDIMVTPQALTDGATYHGYRETRVALENHSPTKSHQVTLVFPDRPTSYGGNTLSRVSRTVVLEPNSQSEVPLWQPPLQASGNNQLRILVDGGTVGALPLPPGQNHAAPVYSGSGAGQPATILLSRALNIDEVNRSLKDPNGPFSASQATGPPNSGGRRGAAMPTAWAPDWSAPGTPWLELGYSTPMTVDRVRIYRTTTYGGLLGNIILRDASGNSLATIPMAGPGYPTYHAASGVYRGGVRGGGRGVIVGGPVTSSTGVYEEFTVGATNIGPVKTVHIDFNGMAANDINIDAVELAGPSGNALAATATASSEGGNGSVTGGGGYNPATRLGPFATVRSEVAPALWGENWLSYTPYDGIMVTAADLKASPPAATWALWRYVEGGGNLLILGESDVPEPWRSLGRATLADGSRYEVGLGHCYVSPGSAPGDLKRALADDFTRAVRAAAQASLNLPDERSANVVFPVVSNFQVPVRGTVFVMLAFVLLIGPVNMLVLSRMNRRIWMLWTIPAISLLTCALVFAWNFFREGVAPYARVAGLTLLDQVNSRATTLGAAALYCPLTPSGGLQYGFDTEVTPLIGENYNGFRGRSSSSGAQREVDWTQSQHLQRGWITARVPAQFYLRKSETRRERLQLETAGNQLIIVNGLGANIKSLWLADRSGRVYHAGVVDAGQKAPLASMTRMAKTGSDSGPEAFEKRIGFAVELPSANFDPADFLRPGSYIAELDRNPFLENGLGAKVKPERLRSSAVVYGILEGRTGP
jgi:hypothetical protein